MSKTYNDINQKIKSGEVCILTAEEMVEFVEKEGISYAAEKVDVVTTGTFGCMCSSGAFFNLKQPDPPIRIDEVWLDGVPAYHGTAAADFYLGVTKPVSLEYLQKFPNKVKTTNYPTKLFGGGHVLERLIQNKSVHLHAISKGTDGYPRKHIEIDVTLDDFNQAYLLNPRNGYQRYACAVNKSSKALYTYMGKLLPNLKNGTFGGVGTLSPLNNDPTYRTIGLGTRIFLGGGGGYVLGEGTQHNPQNQFGNLLVKGNLKDMSSSYLCGASITKYGVSAYIGLGIPIPILDENLAKTCSISDSEIYTSVLDYSTGERDRPELDKISYEELKSNEITIEGKKVPLSTTSSFPKSRSIAYELKSWIKNKKFFLTEPIEPLSLETTYESLNQEVET